MALLDTLNDITSLAPAAKNRVELLLEQIKGDDLDTLQAALRTPTIRNADLTKALRREYGSGVVTDHSISDWRRKHLADVNGL